MVTEIICKNISSTAANRRSTLFTAKGIQQTMDNFLLKIRIEQFLPLGVEDIENINQLLNFGCNVGLMDIHAKISQGLSNLVELPG